MSDYLLPTMKYSVLSFLIACGPSAVPAPDAVEPREFPLAAPCSDYVALEGTVENHGPVPYLLPAGLTVLVPEPTFETLGGACYPVPGGEYTRCYRSLTAVTAEGEVLGVTGRLRPGDAECVWRTATPE